MAPALPSSPKPSNSGAAAGPTPTVRLELHQGNVRPTTHDVADAGFLIGSVPGCDLRLPGAGLPPVICLIAPHASGARLRKLVPTQPVLVNGRPITSATLAHGDRITVGAVELLVHVESAASPY